MHCVDVERWYARRLTRPAQVPLRNVIEPEIEGASLYHFVTPFGGRQSTYLLKWTVLESLGPVGEDGIRGVFVNIIAGVM